MKKKGISLLTLIITIIVVIILAGVVIFSLSKTNVIGRANEAVFKNDVANLNDELHSYYYSKTLEKNGTYNPKLLNADKTMVEYERVVDNTITIKDIIKSLDKRAEYINSFEIYKGELVYIGSNKEEKKWAEEVGIVSKYAEPKVEISGPSVEEIKAGTKVEYEITVISNFKLEYVNFEGNIELVSKTVEETTTIKTIENEKIEVIEESEKLKKVKVEIDTTGLENGEYAIVVKEKIAKDEMEMENTVKKESDTFIVNTIVYEDIKITPSTTNWTNQNVTVTITYPTELTTKEYKIGTGSWEAYTGVVTVTENTTVYARGKDKLGNTTKNSMATLTVENIDKIVPTVSFLQNGGSTTSSSISTKISATDSDSGVKTVQYAWSSSTTTPTSYSTISNNTSTSISSNGTWYLHVKATDNAGNEYITRSSSFTINYEDNSTQPTETNTKKIAGGSMGFSGWNLTYNTGTSSQGSTGSKIKRFTSSDTYMSIPSDFIEYGKNYEVGFSFSPGYVNVDGYTKVKFVFQNYSSITYTLTYSQALGYYYVGIGGGSAYGYDRIYEGQIKSDAIITSVELLK